MAASRDDVDGDPEALDAPFAETDPVTLSRGRVSSRDNAAEWLIAPGALMSLSLVEAKIVVSYMHPRPCPLARRSSPRATPSITASWCCCSLEKCWSKTSL